MATVVTGTAGDDVHVIGIRLVEMALRRGGYEVVALGALVDTAQFVEVAIESAADAIFVSSLNGHAELTLRPLREQLVEAGIGDTLVYAGGQLTIGRPPWAEVERLFVGKLGLDRVYPPQCTLDDVVADLDRDLRHRATGRTDAGRAQ